MPVRQATRSDVDSKSRKEGSPWQPAEGGRRSLRGALERDLEEVFSAVRELKDELREAERWADALPLQWMEKEAEFKSLLIEAGSSARKELCSNSPQAMQGIADAEALAAWKTQLQEALEKGKALTEEADVADRRLKACRALKAEAENTEREEELRSLRADLATLEKAEASEAEDEDEDEEERDMLRRVAAAEAEAEAEVKRGDQTEQELQAARQRMQASDRAASAARWAGWTRRKEADQEEERRRDLQRFDKVSMPLSTNKP
eukprot:TRINITY_DN9241_c1_g1_i3.p1 TRINITY_DN9241_c1_g1~~TRINITY_DN9241_c1_g1_i3.p1  ORF type:complete len:263 (-),score=85.95 TRINITY_DN9241_c1_g1_i3:294-1082(-)